MKKKGSFFLLMIPIFLNLAMPYEVKAINLKEIITKDNLSKSKENKIMKPVDENNLDDNLVFEEKYDDVQEDCNIYFQDMEKEYYSSIIDEKHEAIDSGDDIKNIEDSFFLQGDNQSEDRDNVLDSEEQNKIYRESEEDGKDKILIDELKILWDETQNDDLFIIQNNELEASNIIEYEKVEGENNNKKDLSNNVNDEEIGISLSAFYEEEKDAKDNILNSNIGARSILDNKNLETTEIISELRETSLKLSDLEITKDDNENLKVTFKMDNDLDLKDDKQDLKVYIADNTTQSKKVIISKDKSEEKYLTLDGVTDLSGKNVTLGKDDYLSKGNYTVIFSSEEMNRLKNIGLENLVLKVEADFNGKTKSIIGVLKDSDALEESDILEDDGENIKENENKNSLLSVVDSDNKNKENKDNTESILPKTGMLINNFLIISVGVLFILSGVLELKKSKIET